MADLGLFALGWQTDPPAIAEEPILDQARALARFLQDIEKRAFRIARLALRHDEDALDIVQDSMLQLARRYGERPSAEWRPLFYRILQNRIRDFQRRRKVRARIMAWMPGRTGDEQREAFEENVPDPRPLPGERLAAGEALERLEAGLAALPGRQREAFTLRIFEGMDVAETAQAMGCSEGSVKTHFSRAVHTLRERIGSAW
jgi:RNA polymerase sigma-70 factor (ECF subfamily)